MAVAARNLLFRPEVYALFAGILGRLGWLQGQYPSSYGDLFIHKSHTPVYMCMTSVIYLPPCLFLLVEDIVHLEL
jgi:hypothetical protein